jgi:hypothetical protein
LAASFIFTQWDQQFFDPIELPTGRKLITLRDAANYIVKLPKAEEHAAEWQTAAEVLRLSDVHAGRGGFVRVGRVKSWFGRFSALWKRGTFPQRFFWHVLRQWNWKG